MSEEITQEERDSLAREEENYVRWADELERRGIKPWSLLARMVCADPEQLHREAARQMKAAGQKRVDAYNERILAIINGGLIAGATNGRSAE